MTWVHPDIRDHARREAYLQVAALADWSPWLPFETALLSAPREPGVYLFREPATGIVRYAGMAGERASGGRPKGLYGRLSVYRTGKGAVSGFGEAALDRALADVAWVQEQLESLRTRGPRRAKDWARDAVARLSPEVSWTVSADRADALFLEEQALRILGPHEIWNRSSSRPLSG